MDSPPQRRRGAYAKSAERRREILQTAVEVFGESGFRGSSIREIAARVGMTDTGVVHHFGTKGNLLLEVLKRRQRDDLSQFDVELDPFGRGMVNRNARRPGIVRLFATLSAEATDPEHPANQHFVERYELLRKITAERIELARSKGLLKADIDLKIASQVLIAVMDGLQIQWLLDPNQDMSVAYDDFVKHYFGGVNSEVHTE